MEEILKAQLENTPLNLKSARYLVFGSVIFLLIHFVVIEQFGVASLAFILGLELLKLTCCLWWFSRLSGSPARFRWLCNAAAIAFSSFSLSIIFAHTPYLDENVGLSHAAVLAESLAFVPLLLSVAVNLSRQDSPAVRGIDAALCLPLACLYFAQTYWITNSGSNATSYVLLMNNLRNAFILTCAALQFVAADDEEDRRFLYVILIVQTVTMPLQALRSHFSFSQTSYFIDLPMDLPFLTFFWLALRPTVLGVRRLRPMMGLAHVVRGANPIFMSLALTLLGIAVSRQHFIFGAAGVLMGILGYGLRNAVIHGKLLKTEETLLQAQHDLEVLATHDALTGIPNRRSFDGTLVQSWQHSVRTGQVLAVLMIDIDFFKALNDTCGHQVGDDCLAIVARTIRSTLPRSVDYVSRYGGEEFAAILPGTFADGALQVAERLRSSVLDLTIPHPTSIYDYITVSIGIAVGSAMDNPEVHLLLKTADDALYRAKNSGRNRVEFIDRVSYACSQLDHTASAAPARKTGSNFL